MAITAALVKELRERTGSGMMECKKALVETNGDIDAAVEALRKSGAAKADKKSGRIAAEGRIIIEKSGDGKNLVLLEVNSETDFVATDDNFVNFATAAAKRVIDSKPGSLEELNGLPVSDDDATTIEQARAALNW
jgi:elongation factor Ts